jgi:hypothetical protein
MVKFHIYYVILYLIYTNNICFYCCMLNLFLCRNIIDFGEHRANCCDIQQSFADGACLDNVFMQCFIECVRDDWSKHIPPLNAHQLILDVNVGV